mgnify:FL=1
MTFFGLLPYIIGGSATVKAYADEKMNELTDGVNNFKRIVIAVVIGFVIYQIFDIVLRAINVIKK